MYVYVYVYVRVPPPTCVHPTSTTAAADVIHAPSRHGTAGHGMALHGMAWYDQCWSVMNKVINFDDSILLDEEERIQRGVISHRR